MKVFKQIGSKERFLEMFQNVNKVRLNEAFGQSLNPQSVLAEAFDELKGGVLKVKHSSTQANDNESYVELLCVDKEGNNITFTFKALVEEGDQEGVFDVKEVELENFAFDSVSNEETVELSGDALKQFNTQHQSEMLDIIDKFMDVEEEEPIDTLYEEATKLIDKIPYKVGSEKMVKHQQYADEKPTNSKVRVTDADELKKFVKEEYPEGLGKEFKPESQSEYAKTTKAEKKRKSKKVKIKEYYSVLDSEFNREHFREFIGQTLDKPIPYAQVKKLTESVEYDDDDDIEGVEDIPVDTKAQKAATKDIKKQLPKGDTIDPYDEITLSEEEPVSDAGGSGNLSIGDVVTVEGLGGAYQIAVSHSEGKPFLIPFNMAEKKGNIQHKIYLTSLNNPKFTKIMSFSDTQGGFMREGEKKKSKNDGMSFEPKGDEIEQLAQEKEMAGDMLQGGKADTKSAMEYDPEQVKMGLDVEKEHTDNPLVALEIATDHLEEFGDYYSRLAKMEKEAKAGKGSKEKPSDEEDKEKTDELLGYKPKNVGDDVDDVDEGKIQNLAAAGLMGATALGAGQQAQAQRPNIFNRDKNKTEIPAQTQKETRQQSIDRMSKEAGFGQGKSMDQMTSIKIAQNNGRTNYAQKMGQENVSVGQLEQRQWQDENGNYITIVVMGDKTKVGGGSNYDLVKGQNEKNPTVVFKEEIGMEDYKGTMGDKYADAEGNEFSVSNKVKGGVSLKGQGGEKEVATGDLDLMKKLNEDGMQLSDYVDAPGSTEIWYMKSDSFRDLIHGFEFIKKYTPEKMPDPNNLEKTHSLLGTISETDPETIFHKLNNWGGLEANKLLDEKGVGHTSMSVGDIVKIGNKVLMVDNYGFKELSSAPDNINTTGNVSFDTEPTIAETNRKKLQEMAGGKKTKAFKIGEYAVGGIIKVDVESNNVVGGEVAISALDWNTKKPVQGSRFVATNLNGIEEYLNELTSSYYAGKIMEWIKGNVGGGNQSNFGW